VAVFGRFVELSAYEALRQLLLLLRLLLATSKNLFQALVYSVEIGIYSEGMLFFFFNGCCLGWAQDAQVLVGCFL